MSDQRASNLELGTLTGPWRCQWQQHGAIGMESLFLNFEQEGVHGSGMDLDGIFTYAGSAYADGTVTLTKIYTHPIKPVPASMTYIGRWDGCCIVGEWIDDTCPDWNHGPFRMWQGISEKPSLSAEAAAPLERPQADPAPLTRPQSSAFTGETPLATPNAPANVTTGESTEPAKPPSGHTRTVGALSSGDDSPWTVSFGYFRTKSGLPPKVEATREAAAKPHRKRRDDETETHRSRPLDE